MEIAGGIILITILLVEIGQAVNRWLEQRKIRNANKKEDK